MKCPSCDEILIIKTNPKDRTYDYCDGIKQMEQDYIPNIDDHTSILNDTNNINSSSGNTNSSQDRDDCIMSNMNEQEKAEHMNNPIYRLQNTNIQIQKVHSVNERLESLVEYNEIMKKTDVLQNSILRKKLRMKKQVEMEQIANGIKKGVSYPILPYIENDSIFPRNVIIPTKHKNYIEITTNHANIREKIKFTQLKSESIFGTSSSRSSSRRSSGTGSGGNNANNGGSSNISTAGSTTIAIKTNKRSRSPNTNSNPNIHPKPTSTSTNSNSSITKRQRIHDSKVKQARIQIDTSVFMRR